MPRTPNSPLVVARKLVAIAGEQRDALQRGATTQFDWLTLRRAELTEQLQAFRVEPSETGDEAADFARLRDELASIDSTMEQTLRVRMAQANQGLGQLRRFQKAVAPYFQSGPRVPTFVDKTR